MESSKIMYNIGNLGSKVLALLAALAAAQNDTLLLEQQLLRNLEARNLLDQTWPADNCCRIYEHEKFTVDTAANSQDFCTDNANDIKIIDLTSNYLDNKMDSWKCGPNVAVRFCTQADGTKCTLADDKNWGESAGGYAESQDTGISNSLTRIELIPYEPTTRYAMTVFTDTECHGHSALIWSDELYDQTTGQLTLGNDIMSVMFSEGNDWWADLYMTENCILPSIGPQNFISTIRHNTVGRNDCINVSDRVKNRVNSIKFGKGAHESPINADYQSCSDY